MGQESNLQLNTGLAFPGERAPVDCLVKAADNDKIFFSISIKANVYSK